MMVAVKAAKKHGNLADISDGCRRYVILCFAAVIGATVVFVVGAVFLYLYASVDLLCHAPIVSYLAVGAITTYCSIKIRRQEGNRFKLLLWASTSVLESLLAVLMIILAVARVSFQHYLFGFECLFCIIIICFDRFCPCPRMQLEEKETQREAARELCWLSWIVAVPWILDHNTSPPSSLSISI